jgi:hypothetical protein
VVVSVFIVVLLVRGIGVVSFHKCVVRTGHESKSNAKIFSTLLRARQVCGPATQDGLFGLVRRQRRGPLEIVASLAMSTKFRKKIATHREVEVKPNDFLVGTDRVKQRDTRERAVTPSDRHRTIELHDR